MTLPAAFLMTLALGGCSTAPGTESQDVELGAEVTLAPGAMVSVKTTQMKAHFVGVTEDSRCPRDVTCIWAGEVKAQVEMQRSSQAPTRVEIREGDSADVGVYRVTLVRVGPQPASTVKIAPQDYRATLKIDKAGNP